MAAPTRRPNVDELLAGRYRLGERLGQGGMGEVYDAFDERLDRPVAVKLLQHAIAARVEVRRRFEAEARAAARLSHPNVVAVYDSGEDDGLPWIAMERLPGETLADRLRGEPLDPGWVLRLAGDVLGALAAAHAAGIVHRDIKPANILLGSDGCAKVADFGIAKTLEVGADATNTGMLVGTPAYLAPERLDGDPATPQADLYAVGVVLYEALTGQKAFRATTPVSIAYAVRHTDPPPVRDVQPDVPEHIAAAVHRAMARDPSERFGSAVEMAAALTNATGVTAVTPGVDQTLIMASGSADATRATPATRATGQARTRWIVVALAAVLVALMAVAIGLTATEGTAGGLEGDLRRVADSMEPSDGRRSQDVAQRLRQLATTVETDNPIAAEQANALLRDLAGWQAAGDLQSGAVARVRTVVLRVPGADPSSFAIPPTTVPLRDDKDDDKDRDKDEAKDDDDKDAGEDGGDGRDGEGKRGGDD